MKQLYLTILILAVSSMLYAEPLAQNQRQARRLFLTLGCRACHDFEKSGSTLAPSLERIGQKLNAAQILERLSRAPDASGKGEAFMPSYQTTPLAQRKLLSRFLADRK